MLFNLIDFNYISYEKRIKNIFFSKTNFKKDE